MLLILRRVLDVLDNLRLHHRRRLPFVTLPLERRRPRIAAEGLSDASGVRGGAQKNVVKLNTQRNATKRASVTATNACSP